MSDKQDLTDKLNAYIDLTDKLDSLDSDLSDVESALSVIVATEPRACDFRPLLRNIGDELATLLESVRERSNELENELDAYDCD